MNTCVLLGFLIVASCVLLSNASPLGDVEIKIKTSPLEPTIEESMMAVHGARVRRAVCDGTETGREECRAECLANGSRGGHCRHDGSGCKCKPAPKAGE